MPLPKLPYSNQIKIYREIRIFWGADAAWKAAKHDRSLGDRSCVILPKEKSITEFNLSVFRGWPILIKIFFNATEKEERFLAGVLLKAGVTQGVFLRVTQPSVSYQLFGNVRVRGCN